MLNLATGEIHLWLTDERAIHAPELLAAYHGLLNAEERVQQQRFHFEKDRHRYLVTRALTRSVLSRYAPVPPPDWHFRKLEHGRPQIVNPEAEHLVFNLTHTAGLIALGITRMGELGIDTENIMEREAPLDVASRYFSARETTDLHALPLDRQQEIFFHYWTLKEAYIKARSQGLSLPLDQFTFSHVAEPNIDIDIDIDINIAISFDARLADNPAHWDFWLLRPTREHLLAVCATRTPALQCHEPRQIFVRQITPLAHEQLVQPTLLRRSQNAAWITA